MVQGDNSMRAWSVTKWISKLSDLTMVTSHANPAPPAAGEVLVRVKAAGANFFDGLMVQGKYQIRPPLPFIPGAEFAGVIEAVGDGVDGLAVGQRVFGGNVLGCYADRVTVPSAATLAIPDSLSFSDACGIYLTYPTAYAGLTLRGGLKAGETCLVHAAAGGVGSCAVQLAKALGATVIATAGSDEKLQVAKRAGADVLINYRDEAWPEAVREATGGRGVDVVFDPVGLIVESTKCIAWNGRIVVVGFTKGDIPKIPANRILLKNIAVTGLHWGAYAYSEPEQVPKVWSAVLDLLSKGTVKPILYDQLYPLERLPDALHAIENRSSFGKVVIDVDLPDDERDRFVAGSSAKL
mmetsp:Transcript_4891/g.15807  ORF Transcript_4891/g.15807 Transcript_4891/m.15807 type:complete len:352 (+) Transcript_4891:1-1056(+)